VKFLNESVKVGTKVKAMVKSSDQLISEGWTPTSKGGLEKTGVFFKFNSKKRSTIGKMIEGTIELNPKRNLCVIDKNGWGFDESMLSSFIVDHEPTYNDFSISFGGVDFYGNKDGTATIVLEDEYGGELSLSKEETKNLTKNLLRFYKWMD
jgi:hypothetical protein